MYVWAFTGNLGEGKTSAMSILAHYYRAKARRARQKIELYSNYGLRDSKRLMTYKDFYNVAESQGSILCLDEAQTSLDSRLFQKGSNIYLTQFLFYLRKLRSSLFMTTPHFKNLDSRMRALCNILVDCHRTPGGFIWFIYDAQAQKLLRRRFVPMFKAKQIFDAGLYDTNKIVTAVSFPKNEREFTKFLHNIVEVNEKRMSAMDVLSDAG
ncbi:MAG TPA: hypothetical protein DEF34_10175 [Desulfotomaculum sp.]|nr:MAG: hypothetical protein JL56_05880 [Desulfotomaculum sp. BICA1-6]HBX23980.1 hypothetical protein [Desulfotomaculum sp.]